MTSAVLYIAVGVLVLLLVYVGVQKIITPPKHPLGAAPLRTSSVITDLDHIPMTPDKIMFTYKCPLRELRAGMKTTIAHWQNFAPHLKVVYLDNDQCRRLLADHFGNTEARRLWDTLKGGAQKADLVRIVYLLKYGGFYSDVDQFPLRQFRLRANKPTDVLLSRDNPYFMLRRGIFQSFVGVGGPNHPFIAECLRTTLHYINGCESARDRVLQEVLSLHGMPRSWSKSFIASFFYDPYCFGGPASFMLAYRSHYGCMPDEKVPSEVTMLSRSISPFRIFEVFGPDGEALLSAKYDGYEDEIANDPDNYKVLGRKGESVA